MKTFFSIASLSICAVILTFLIGSFNAYFYPMKYSEHINQLSSEFNIDGAIIASVANVESNFDENALSNKGAIGIMQLMPSTAKWLAEKLNTGFSEDKLYDGEYNLMLGSYYLSYLIDYFQDEKLGICAYNAGQGNVSSWLKNEEYSKDGQSLDVIPFEETRNYCNKVFKNYNYYKNRYK